MTPTGDRFEVYSAGLEPNQGINPYTIRVMEEIGYDMSGHHAKGLREFLGRVHFGYMVTVCDRADQIQARVTEWVASLPA